MIGKCIKTKVIDKQMSLDFGVSDQIIDYSHNLEINGTYEIYAILKGKLSEYYLIYSYQYVSFVNAKAFDIIDDSRPSKWISKEFSLGNNTHYLEGYELLVKNMNHYNGLLENNYNDVIKFLKLNDVISKE